VFKVIQTFTSEENLEKVFSIKDSFIQVIQLLKEDDSISNNYKVIRDGHAVNTNKLTSKNINV
jgi:hypothetical protein